MEERTIYGLNLTNEDYIFAGDLTIEGNVVIKNGHLIVSGCLVINDFSRIFIDGDISAGSILILSSRSDSIQIKVNGDIFSAGFCFIRENLICNNFYAKGVSRCSHISCLNYLVDGDSDCGDIKAEESIYILGDSDSYSLTAVDAFIGGNARFFNQPINVSRALYIGNPDGCSSFNVGN